MGLVRGRCLRGRQNGRILRAMLNRQTGMNRLTLKQRLANYMRRHHGWIASGELQRLASEKTNYTPQNVGRRLRELENEGLLEVQYRKNHAYYRIRQTQTMDEWWNS